MAVLDRPPPPAPPERAPGRAKPPGPFTRFRLGLGRAWEVVRDISAVLHPPRFSLFMVLAGGALLLANEQGRDLAVGLVGGDLFPNGLAFHACVLLWAFQSWRGLRADRQGAAAVTRAYAPAPPGRCGA